MLRCRIELVPFGDESRARTLGTIIIGNDGTGVPADQVGNYSVRHVPPLGGDLAVTRRLRRFGRRHGYLALLGEACRALTTRPTKYGPLAQKRWRA